MTYKILVLLSQDVPQSSNVRWKELTWSCTSVLRHASAWCLGEDTAGSTAWLHTTAIALPILSLPKLYKAAIAGIYSKAEINMTSYVSPDLKAATALTCWLPLCEQIQHVPCVSAYKGQKRDFIYVPENWKDMQTSCQINCQTSIAVICLRSSVIKEQHCKFRKLVISWMIQKLLSVFILSIFTASALHLDRLNM